MSPQFENHCYIIIDEFRFCRFLHVYKPLVVMRLNMYRYAKYALLSMTMTGVGISLPSRVTRSLLMDESGLWRLNFKKENPDEFYTNVMRMDITLFAIVPLLIIIPINTTTVILLAMRRQNKLSESSSKKSDGSTVMLLSVVLFFTILIMPRAFYVVTICIGRQLPPLIEEYVIDVGTICSNANQSVNFVIYFVVGPSFRKKIKALLYYRTEGREKSTITNETY